MRKFTLLLIIFSSFSCNKKDNLEPVVVQFQEFKKSDTLEERNYIAVFDDKTEKKTTLSKSELKIINTNLVEAVNKFNNELKLKIEKWNKENESNKRNFNDEKIDLRYYFRQYSVLINENGEKIINVFCFCGYMSDWREEKIHVMDGGDCYLNSRINISKKIVEYFGTHGLA
ncbi:hypothetical protein [Kaistella faecalis]|uniref:hypothetical protein n=1 Tax=Kaistella faecalis TaxID=2852098 RepID=UPI001C44B50E|nr:hypothetical protein [Chryseobacterium faecale]UFK97838.1 hypothetical protein LL667_00450 [Chryseobacterium faecale]